MPRDDKFGAVKELLDRGVIRNAALREVLVADVKTVPKVFGAGTGPGQ